MRIFSAYQIKPTGSDVPLSNTTLTSAGLFVYANTKLIPPNRQDIYSGIVSGSIYCENLNGQVMSSNDVLRDIIFVADQAEAVYDFTDTRYQVLWNINLAPQVVSFVRGQMLDISLSQMGLSATSMLSKLSSVISAVNVGMYKEAGQMLQYQVTRDAFLTEERITTYVNLLTSADAIDYTIPV